MISLFGLITFVLHNLEKNAFFKQELSDFERIVRDKNRRISGLLDESEEVFSNYDSKIQLVESFYLDYINRLRENLLSENSNRHNLAELSLPFDKESAIFINRRDRLFYQAGHDFEDLYGEGWYNRFTLALRNRYNDDYFSRAQTIIPYPVNFEQFANFSDGFQTIFVNGEFVHRYFFETGRYTCLLLVRLNKISRTDLIRQTIKRFKTIYPYLSYGQNDIFAVGDKKIKLSDSPDGLHYFLPEETYQDFLKKNPLYIFWGLITVSILYLLGGYMVVATRFEFRFALLYFLMLWILHTGFSHFFHLWQDNSCALLLQSAEIEADSYVKKLQGLEFENFQSDLTRHLSSKIEDDDLFSDKVWTEGFQGLLFKKGGKFTFSAEEHGALQKNLLLHFMAEALFYRSFVFAGFDESYLRSTLSQETIENLQNYKKIWRENGFDNHLAPLPFFLQKSMDTRRDTKAERPFTDVSYQFGQEGRGRLFMTRALSRAFHFYWEISGDKEDFSILAAFAPGVKIFELFLQEKQSGVLNIENADDVRIDDFVTENGDFFAFRASDRQLVYNPLPVSGAELMIEIDHLWNSTGRFSGKIGEFKWYGKPAFYIFSNSDKFDAFRYLFVFYQDKLFAPVLAAKRHFFYFSCSYFIFALFLQLMVLRRILRSLKLIKSGFIRLEKEEPGFLLPVSGADEFSGLLARFNHVSREMAQRKKMLPFVTDNLLELLENSDSLRGGFVFSGESVVVFSDIRSFTTISETYPPEEVVEMLNGYFSIWQRKVEKYGGIVERFVGDAIRVVFFARNQRHYAQNALQTAVEVMEELKIYNKKRREEGGFEIKIGIGVAGGNTGFTIVGGVQKMELVLLGEAAFLSEKLESESKNGRFSCVLVNELVYNQVRHIYDFAPLSMVNDSEDENIVHELIL
jgi:class 3 adenylate cyclase